MKKICLIALALIGISARAQYFQHIYGTSNYDELTSGVNTFVNPQGQFMAGENQHPCLPGVFGVPAVYCDVNGNVPGAPYFKNDYYLVNSNGTFMLPEDAQVFELDNGTGFGIIGKYYDPNVPNPNSGVYYMKLNPNGVPVATYTYTPVGGGGYAFFDIQDVGGVAESVVSAGNDVYVTGTVQANNGDFLPFAMKINVNNGAQLWGRVYVIQQNPYGNAWGRDITENPMAPMGQQWAEFVGEVLNTQQGNTYDGYLQHIDLNTGIPTHPTIFYGTPNSSDHWNSIAPCVGPPGPFPPGFILGGGTDVQGSMDYWALRMDPLIAHFWSNSYDYSAAGFQYDICLDVMERINTANQPEYYATGFTDNGSIGGYDMVTLKLNTFGAGVGEFTYGSLFGDEGGIALDQFNGTPADGLTQFGNWDGGGLGGNTDFYLVKSYFNGISGCNEAFSTPTDVPEIGPGLHIPSVDIAKFNAGTMSNNFLPVSDATLCYAVTIGGGSNARVANPNTGAQAGGKHGSDAVKLVPNPAESGAASVSLSINTDMEGPATVSVYDMLGKLQYSGNYTLVKGNNTLPLDMSKTSLSAGTYNVVVHNGSTAQNTILLVK